MRIAKIGASLPITDPILLIHTSSNQKWVFLAILIVVNKLSGVDIIKKMLFREPLVRLCCV